MNCRTAEGMVNGYINHELSLKELEEFLDHIQTCSSCYDELETYFIFSGSPFVYTDRGSGSVYGICGDADDSYYLIAK